MTRKTGKRRTCRDGARARRATSVMVLGVGAFAHSTAQILADAGASVSTYLTRDYGHYPPSLAGTVI